MTKPMTDERRKQCDNYFRKGGHGLCYDEIRAAGADCLKEIDRLHEENERLKHEMKDLQLIIKRRKREPTHGPCCTCQICGEHHDDCRCDLDDVVDELEKAEKENTKLRKVVEAANIGLERMSTAQYVTADFFDEYYEALRELEKDGDT